MQRIERQVHTMADKFPEIDDTTAGAGDVAPGSDFLSREKEVLGDEFSTANDAEVLKETGDDDDDEEEEFEDFKSQFPEVGGAAEAAEEAHAALDHDAGATEHAVVNKFGDLKLDESEHVQEWKKTRELEVAKRDEIAERKLKEVKAEAEKAIDDFYENYNNKKDDAIAETKKAEAAFLEKRDSFLEHGTLWDRAVELLKLDRNSDAVDTENLRDKTKFRDLLLALKGKENVPGAAGV